MNGMIPRFNFVNVIEGISSSLDIIKKALPLIKSTGPTLKTIQNYLGKININSDEKTNKKENITKPIKENIAIKKTSSKPVFFQ